MARFATFTVGSQVIVLPKGLKFEYPERARGQLHRHARRRQAQEAADRPVGALRRRGLPPPRLPRHHRPAADRRGVRAVHGLDRPRQAGEAGRRAARPQGVLRDLGEQVGRAAPDQVVERRSATRRCSCTTTGSSSKIAKNMPMDEMVQELLGASGGTFKNPATNYYQDDDRDPAADRERRPGLHGHAHPVRPVPQPPVRPLDAERLLRLRRLLLADRPQAGRGLPRDDRLQLRRRRGAATRSAAR